MIHIISVINSGDSLLKMMRSVLKIVENDETL